MSLGQRSMGEAMAMRRSQGIAETNLKSHTQRERLQPYCNEMNRKRILGLAFNEVFEASQSLTKPVSVLAGR